jgi:excisionase family DNA binding protein
MKQDVLTVSEAAREIGIPLRTLYNRIRSGDCTALRLGPRAIVVTRTEVERQKQLGTLKSGPKGPRKKTTEAPS